MEFVVDRINASRVGAKEPDLVLVSGDLPSYAVIATESTSVEILSIKDIRGLDKRPGQRRDRRMAVLATKWQGHSVNVGLCHCPSNK